MERSGTSCDLGDVAGVFPTDRRHPSTTRWTSLLTRLSVLTLAVLMTTGCTSQETTTGPATGADAVSDTRQSHLGDEGIAVIKSTGAARLDLQDHAIAASEVGVEEGRMGPIIGSPSGPVIDLTLVGPRGEDTVETSVFGVLFDTDGSGLSVTWTTSYDAGEGLSALRAERRRWGLRASDLQFLAEDVQWGGEVDRVLGPSVAQSGLVVSTTARFGRRDVLQFEVLLSDAYYTPKALAQIERGEIP
ncbi:hypothetical protein [Nocardioides dokdonensis]|uniref:hypothetical protein n=1 Tax=Nocardioides dokdonensis TaxID=450734 RepID=UPI0012F80F85|nr:hypothetical protein [Nocardioides dokdonensis]